MLQSPAKRRKTSVTTAIPATEQNTNNQPGTTPTTPTRASYLSPTKASLARSHPHLVSNSNSRTLTEPRGRLLRSELLGSKDQAVTQKPQSNSIEDWKENASEQPETQNPQADNGLNIASPTNAKPSLPQPSAQNPNRQESDSPEPVSPKIVPRLVQKSDALPRRASRRPSNEPDLPPTPVQLGLDPPPERPRGLSSSSPGGSKSGSGSRRIRALNGQRATSSPLKAKANTPVVHDLESQLDLTQEVPVNQMSTSDAAEEEMPEGLKAQTQTVHDLRDELSKLEADTKTVEEALEANDLPEATAKKDFLMGLLKTDSRSETPTNQDFEQQSGNAASKPPYRHLFAPANLQLDVKTVTKMMGGHAKTIQHISLTPPSPWPSSFFAVNFEVITDAEEAIVEKVTWVDVLKGHKQAIAVQDELYSWIQARLKSDLHCLDVGGLIWGIGQYFKASIERAKTFKTLAKKYMATMDDSDSDKEISEDDESANKDGRMTKVEANSLSRFLTKSELKFEAKPDSESTMLTRRSKRSAPKIIAIWKIQPTWHGELKSVWEIAPSGVPDSAQDSAAELFDRASKIGGFEKAFGAVWDMLLPIGGQGVDGDVKESEVGKGAGRKRKRFT